MTASAASRAIAQTDNQDYNNKGYYLNPNAMEFYPNHTYNYPTNYPFNTLTTFSPSCNYDHPPPPPSIQLPHHHFHNNFQFYPSHFSSDRHLVSAGMTLMSNSTHYNYQNTLLVQPMLHPPPPPPPPAQPVPSPSAWPNGIRVREEARHRNYGKRKGFTGSGSGRGIVTDTDVDHQGQNGNNNHRGRGRGRGRVGKWGGERNYREVKVMAVTLTPDGLETTAMIKNIPNQYTRRMLTKFLDVFCDNENQKFINDETDSGECQSDHPLLAFDFLYLPIDFKTEANKGYAFVNFTHPIAVWKLHLACNNKGWKHCSSSKMCQIAYATIQGKEKLVEHFGRSRFVCCNEEFLPVCFSPPRDGSGAPITQTTIGERVPSSSHRRR